MTDEAQLHPAYFHVEELAWADDRAAGTIPPAMLEEAARRGGGGRKHLATGQSGFHSTFSTMPPGYSMPLHRHDDDEMVVVLDGGCTMTTDPVTLGRNDSMILPAGVVHGFTAGPEGMTLLTISRRAYRTELVDGGPPA